MKVQRKIHIKKGDQVIVISGDYKGQEGRVLTVLRDTYRAIVEGINQVSKHTKPNAQYPQGGIIKKEAPIHISNLMLIDPKTGEKTRIVRKKDKNGRTIRISKKSGEVIK